MKSNLPKAITLGIVTGIVGLIVSLLPIGPSVEEDVGLEWLFKLRGVREPPPDVLIVSIDKTSADTFNLPNKPEKWPRSLHAALIKNLVAAGAQVIAFDIIFDEPRSPVDDNAFARAVKDAGNVVLFEYLKKEVIPLTYESGKPQGNLVKEVRVPPIPPLAQAALALAPFPLPKIPAKVSQVWAFKQGAGDTPTLPVVAFQVFALQAYDEFLSLLQDISPRDADKLPANAEGIMRTKAIEELIRSLRVIFKTKPSIANEMLAVLERRPLTRKNEILRSLVRMYQGGNSYYLNYYGPARSVTTLAYHEALQPESDRIGRQEYFSFNGKAVFVGFSERLQPEQKDDFYTVFTSQSSGVNISGVEIAAAAFANLLEDMPVRPLSPPVHLGTVLLWGLLIGVIFRLLPAAGAIASSLALSAFYLTLAYYQFKSLGIWFPVVVPVLFQAPGGLFAAVLWRYADTNRERQHIRKVFGKYVPNKVVDQLARNVSDIRAKSEVVYGTCLLTDAAQYTALCERIDDLNELKELMDDYYGAVFPPVTQHGGIVIDVKGDAMLGIWDGPQPNVKLREAACLASLDIARAVERFNQRFPQHKLPTRIGLHYGQVLLGTVGAGEHYEYRPQGDTVNTAERIENANKELGTRVLVSEEVLEGLEDFLSRELGKFLLVGKSKALVLHELISRKEDSDESQERLCEAFAEALASFRMQRWEKASAGFSRLLKEHGPDRPSQLYLKLCREYKNNPPTTSSWDSVIPIERK